MSCLGGICRAERGGDIAHCRFDSPENRVSIAHPPLIIVDSL